MFPESGCGATRSHEVNCKLVVDFLDISPAEKLPRDKGIEGMVVPLYNTVGGAFSFFFLKLHCCQRYNKPHSRLMTKSSEPVDGSDDESVCRWL